MSTARRRFADTFQAVDRNDPPSPKLSSSPQRIDWDKALLEADYTINSVGYWLLSDTRSSRRLQEGARQYDETKFSSVLSPLLEQCGQQWRKAARHEGRKEHEISHYLENNHEALSEWLYAKLNGIEKVYKGQGKHRLQGTRRFSTSIICISLAFERYEGSNFCNERLQTDSTTFLSSSLH